MIHNRTQTISTFIDFFTERGHQPDPGSSLVPAGGDPVLFTTSGMHPLTPYLEGRRIRAGRRLIGLQRCLRTTDLDEVGDETHLTVFEMLGSWSLGDYEGPQSLRWGYELVADGFGIGPRPPACDRVRRRRPGGPDTESLRDLGGPRRAGRADHRGELVVERPVGPVRARLGVVRLDR